MALNVLIVDDCELIRTMLARTLDLSGVSLGTLYEAGNGREALDIVRSAWVDLIIADLNMPVMDGVQMIDHLQADGLLKTIPVVVVSTEGSQTRVEELRGKGVSAYVRKPAAPEAIRDVIHEVLGRTCIEGYRQALEDTFFHVIEEFALMLGEPSGRSNAASLLEDGWVQAKISFRGSLAGVVAVAAPKGLVRTIAANVLGREPDDPAAVEAAPSAAKELVNLVAGRLLTEVAGEVPVFDLSAPVFGSAVVDEFVEEPERVTASFLVEGDPLVLSASIRRVDA